MKFLIFLLSLSLNATEVSILKKAILRDENFNPKIQDVKLINLTSPNSYEGKYFKIVLGKSNQAISFSDLEDLQLKAATTYYHLNLARNYFINTVHSETVENLPQIVIRLNLSNVFNELGHFSHDNLDPQFNNALSIPAGDGYAPKNILPWGSEIWFRPSREIKLDDTGAQNFKNAFALFRNQAHMNNFNQFITNLLLANTFGQGIVPLLQSSILVESIYQSSAFFGPLFEQKIYRLDSALVPEIIYHEFAHIALSDRLELTHSTPVNEGLADYFAGKISKSKKLATNIKEYNLYSGKKVRNRQQYQAAFERGDFANTDFVFGLLWNIGEIIGDKEEAEFIYKITEKIDTNDSVRDGLISATLDTCREFCVDSFNDRLKLYKLFQSKSI